PGRTRNQQRTPQVQRGVDHLDLALTWLIRLSLVFAVPSVLEFSPGRWAFGQILQTFGHHLIIALEDATLIVHYVNVPGRIVDISCPAGGVRDRPTASKNRSSSYWHGH